jgi:anaerobic selenocysteine-containing dehydrogenase
MTPTRTSTPLTPAADRPVRFDDHARQRTEYTTCYMCACRCGIKVTLQDDPATADAPPRTSIRFIQGNPDHPVNQGVLCAKGSAGIQKQYSRAKLSHPMIRRPGTERGAGVFDPISWDDALELLTARLAKIRATEPRRLAFFTGRDQMQALTGLWSQQFGTPNWAAHGGFCSVNIAAAGLYSIGYSFWEFGAPDWDRARYFMMWGVAEDHASNPIKIGLEKLKRNGAKFVSVNPVRTGYSAIADEWVPIRPGTDGLLAMAIAHVLLSREMFDWDFLVRYTNAAWLVIQAPGTSRDGLFLRDAQGLPLIWDQHTQAPATMTPGATPALFGEFVAPGGERVRTAMSLMAERALSDEYAPETVAAQCGVPAQTIERIALEMGQVAFEQAIELPIAWTDAWGVRHDKVVGRPVAMYAMRGVSAHSNGFQTCRALHLIQMLLGALDGPGNFRSRAPFPKPVPPHQLPENDAARFAAPDTPCARPLLGFPTRPEDLAIDAAGTPLRVDKAYSWESPIAAHGLMHMVIRNAVEADPYPIDTLLLFMANMAWNSSMNTTGTQAMLTSRDERGDYRIPFVVVADAFDSETVRYADLVLPDTTYFERFDAISMLDRPISEPDAAADAIRHPLIAPDRDVRPWQEVLVDLAGRLKFPAFVDAQGAPKYAGYEDFIVRYEKAPGIGFLAGWRGADGAKSLVGEPNPRQWDAYIENQAFFAHHWPDSQKYMRFANREYLEAAVAAGFIGKAEPIVMQLYSEPLQTFRLAGQGLYDGPRPTRPEDRERLARYFDPLPFWYPPIESARTDEQSGADAFPFHAITQRPMMMYHSWDSQNAWLRQIVAENALYMNTQAAAEQGLADGDWVWVESMYAPVAAQPATPANARMAADAPRRRIRCRLKTMEGCERHTVWTWNAIGKMSGTWGLSPEASESNVGFLLNHLISESLPSRPGEASLTNSDPITGQAAWYDLKVRVLKADGPDAR